MDGYHAQISKPTVKPVTYRVNDAVHAFGLSRSTLYAYMKKGALRTVKVGGRRLIPADALMALVLNSASQKTG